jgi:hypothetical protein
MKMRHHCIVLVLFTAAILSIPSAFAQSTAFSYQGQLANNGSPANGSYDLAFTLYDSTNVPGNVIAFPVTNNATAVSNGLFTTTIDFGAGVFAGNTYWLEVAVRTNGGTGFTTLSPRQQITPTPYSIYSANAGNASAANFVNAANVGGTLSQGQLPGNVVFNGQTGLNLTGTFTGDGSGLTVPINALTVISNTVVGWGNNDHGQVTFSKLVNVKALAEGGDFSVALKGDGTVTEWGNDTIGDTEPPAGLTNVTAIAAGADFVLALKQDGTVTGWGDYALGQTTPPPGLSNVVAVSAGTESSFALKSDGTVVAWGWNTYGQTDVPAGLTNVVAVAGGFDQCLALKKDGTVVAWGSDSYGQTDVPAGLANVVAIAAGQDFSVALKNDGTVVTWGVSLNGTLLAPPSSVTAISCGQECVHF